MKRSFTKIRGGVLPGDTLQTCPVRVIHGLAYSREASEKSYIRHVLHYVNAVINGDLLPEISCTKLGLVCQLIMPCT